MTAHRYFVFAFAPRGRGRGLAFPATKRPNTGDGINHPEHGQLLPRPSGGHLAHSELERHLGFGGDPIAGDQKTAFDLVTYLGANHSITAPGVSSFCFPH